jgi:D-glycero-D-manno-heptose 1,7-bisphosphate phosphatase
MTIKAIFLDKDGTLIEDVPYNTDPSFIRLTAGAVEGLRRLQEAGYLLIVVSNQSGIARGFFQKQDLVRAETYLRGLLYAHGIFLTGFYFCPHYPQAEIREYAVNCFCRKPHPGMIYQAAYEHQINLTASWLIGDILHDVEAGKRAGCRTVLINHSHEIEPELTLMRQPDFVVKNLDEAADTILGRK